MEGRRIEGSFNQGWPFAIFITALAVACFVGAFMINRATYHDPREPLSPSKARAESTH